MNKSRMNCSVFYQLTQYKWIKILYFVYSLEKDKEKTCFDLGDKSKQSRQLKKSDSGKLGAVVKWINKVKRAIPFHSDIFCTK